LFLPVHTLEYSLYGTSLLFLALLGAVSAKTGGSSIVKAVVRVTFWGTIAMGLTAVVGYLFGAQV
jgi:vacuolar iron transporter family protein